LDTIFTQAAISIKLAYSVTIVLKQTLIDNQIPDQLAIRVLRGMTEDATADLRKVPDHLWRLQSIDAEVVSKDDYQRYGFTAPEEFAVNFLEPLHSQGILGRPAGEGGQGYRLKGFTWLLREFGMLS